MEVSDSPSTRLRTELGTRTRAQARLVSVFLEFHPIDDPHNQVREWLDKKGYSVPKISGSADVADLKKMQGDGIFYFDTHSTGSCEHNALTLDY